MEFEQKIKRIQEISNKLEKGKMTFEQNITLFKEGAQLIKECQQYLKKTKLEIKKISNEFPILREARREVLEDLMNVRDAKRVLEWMRQGPSKDRKREIMKNFYLFFSEHDRRRKANFLAAFPEMRKFWMDCKLETVRRFSFF